MTRLTLVLSALALAALLLGSPLAVQAAKGGDKGGGKPGGGGGEDPPAASPEIAYFVSKGDKLMVMDADGENQTLVLRRVSGFGVQPAWSPDGAYVIFHATNDGNGVYVAALAGGGATKLTATATQYLNRPAWSPVPTLDGNHKILFEDQAASGSRDLFLMNTDGTGRVNLTNTPDIDEQHPAWNGDATQIATIASFADENGTWGSEVRVHDLGLDAGALALGPGNDITAGTDLAHGDLAFLDWGGPQGELAVSCYDAGDATWDIWVLDEDGVDAPRNLTDTPNESERHPTWSPDGSQVAYQLGDSDGTVGVCAVTSEGGTPSLLAADGLAPHWRR